MTNPYPLPRETRETDAIAGDGRATYGPFAFRIWDTADVVAIVRRAGSAPAEESATIVKVGNQQFDVFTATFSPALAPGDSAIVQSRRLHERSTDVTRGGAISGQALERELSVVGTVLQELRRDVDAKQLTGGGGGGGPGEKGDKGDKGDKGEKGDSGEGSGGGSADAANVSYRPLDMPTLLIPVSERLGAEVFLTDGYVSGDNLTDFTALAKQNLARAVQHKKPFIIPQGVFYLKEQLVGMDTGISVMGYGKTLSALRWTADATSTGFRFEASAEGSKPDFMHFRDFALYTEKQAEGEAIYASFAKQIRPNNGNAVIVNRWSTRFRAQDVTIEGLGNAKAGWLKGITCLYEIDAILRDVQFRGGIDGTEPNYTAEWAFYIGSEDGSGYGHPTGPFVDTCNVFHAKRAVVLVGNEGGVVTNCQLVGVRVGVDFVDRDGRPLLMLTNNHINAYDICCRVNAAQQVQIIGNSMYHTGGIGDASKYGDGIGIAIGSATARTRDVIITNNVFAGGVDASKQFTAIVVYGGDNGLVDYNSVISALIGTGQQNTRLIVLGADSRFWTVGDHNIAEYAGSGRDGVRADFINDGGQNNFVPGSGARYSKQNAQYAAQDTAVAFENANDPVGPVVDMSGGTFTVPTTGVWHFTFGVNAQPTTGGVVMSIRKNSPNSNAIASDTKDYTGGTTPVAFCITTGPIRCVKGDQIFPRFGPGNGTTINVHPATFFEARRLK